MSSADFHHLDAAHETLGAAGALEVHRARFFRAWLNHRPLDSGRSRLEHFFPLALRQVAPTLLRALNDLVKPVSEHLAEDSARRLLLRLNDGHTVESVLLPRGGVCVSTQVGCAVGCRFCMTGRDGLLRQVGSAEIVAQVVYARSRQPVRKVVFMGMGEPAHNLQAVLEAIDMLALHGGIAHKQLVFSTVGDSRAFEALSSRRIKPALALSLHTTKAALRRELLPRAPDLTPEELTQAAGRYAEATGYPVQYQWTLLEGINDGDDELQALAQLIGGQYAMVNLIPFNTVDGSGYSRPSMDRAAEMSRWLNRRGILTRLRHSAGQDVEGGCGQLRARGAPSVVRLVRSTTQAA